IGFFLRSEPVRLCGSIIVPEGVTEITDDAFVYSKGLTSITLPSTLKKLGRWVWNYCTTIEKVTCNFITPMHSNENSFTSEVYNNAILEVPLGTTYVFRQIEPWSHFWYKNIIEIEPEEGDIDISLSHSNININYLETGQILVDILGHKIGTHNLKVTLTDCDGNVKTGQCEIVVTNKTTLIEEINADEDKKIGDIYSINGMLIKQNPAAEDIEALTPGLYIIGDKKVLIR
ncbi:MAG: leucine-rich repeat protein, partial [Bacteroidales bacterium]|nr:leucine-rich repeat protein [Bacteroidales bacterium]